MIPLLSSIRRATKRWRHASKLAWLLFFVGVVLAFVIWLFGSSEGSISVCTKTGMLRYWRKQGLFQNEHIEQTPLSRILIETGYRQPNEHEWLYAHGGGFWLYKKVYSASGAALGMPGTLQNPEVASGVRLLIEYTDKPTVERWLARVFDPDLSSQMRFYLGDLAAHTNRLDFLQYLTKSEEMFQEMETPKPDGNKP